MLALAILAAAHPSGPKPAWIGHAAGYRFIKWTRDDPEEETLETLFVKDQRGRIVARLHDYRVSSLFPDEPPTIRDLDHDGIPEIVLTTWTGGAHGDNTYEIWSLGKRPRCLLAYEKGNVSDEHDFDFVDLDGDGIPEIRSWYDGLSFTVGGPNWHNLPIVLKLEGGRYVDRTSQFPRILRKAAESEWKNLRASNMKAVPESWEGPTAFAINIVALAEITGTRPQAWRRLKKALPPKTYAWVKQREPSILAIVRGREARYAYPPAYARTPVSYSRLRHYESVYGAFEKVSEN